MPRTVAVGMAEIKTSSDPAEALVALGLGSCIGICLFDRRARVAGMVHVMLPSSGGKAGTPGKYADTGVPALVEAITKAGGNPKDCLCALAGGAEVFSMGQNNPTLAIGKRNAEAAREALKQAGLRVMSEDLGGSTGRTVSLYVETGLVTVRPVGGNERDLAKLG